jgi:hypothetical protein
MSLTNPLQTDLNPFATKKIPMKKETLAIKFWAFAISCIFCLGITCISLIEFHWAKWTRSNHPLPMIASTFRSVYLAGLGLPFLTAFMVRLPDSASHSALRSLHLFGLVTFLHMFWFFFWLVAMYLLNQTLVM